MSSKDEFLEKVNRSVEQNISDVGYGVAQLADDMAISRSTLLRMVKKHTGMSANDWIKEVRLDHAKSLLSESGKTVSEISFETGFSSASYFIKCYKDKYGISPGEQRNRDEIDAVRPDDEVTPVYGTSKGSNLKYYLIALALIIAVTSVWMLKVDRSDSEDQSIKSIAVLPFINESADSTNRYFINGMMESILNNLQKIEGLRVISRTSVEQYRNKKLTIPEIAKELSVDYVVEGSGQKYNNEILLTIQLIEASRDQHMWAEQYRRNLDDVFALQAEVSKMISQKIAVVIGPETEQLIDEVPTENLVAYDYYLRGLEEVNKGLRSDLDTALDYFQRSIVEDPEFANAYAYSAICFYYKDIFLAEKKFTDQIADNADKAYLINPQLPEALIAKGLYYMHMRRYTDARLYFEKVLELNPNSAWTHNFLSEIYNKYLPDQDKYLVHALAANQLDFDTSDSSNIANSYLILSNAFAQTGLMSYAKDYVTLSLRFDPQNIISNYMDIYVDMSFDLNMKQARERMEAVYKMDSNRIDVVHEMANVSYIQGDFVSAEVYFDRFILLKEQAGFNVFPEDDISIAYVKRARGDLKTAKVFRDSFENYISGDSSKYRPFNTFVLLLYDGEEDEALVQLERFSYEKDIIYWIVLMLESDPMVADVQSRKAFQSSLERMKANFEVQKEQRLKMLKDRELL
jgi:TolB-like protein/AraC-like DNA-binding protein